MSGITLSCNRSAPLGIAILGDAASVGHTCGATPGPSAIRDAGKAASPP
jgi:hypothetical protein